MVAPASMADFDAAPVTDAAAELLPCCASRRWINQVVKGRPYRSVAALTDASDRVLAGLDWPDVQEALAAHPRIGERRLAEGSWSGQEQSGVRRTDDETAAALRETGLAYERRFGHIFLISASGLSGAQVLASLRARLDNEPGAERWLIRQELAKIVRVRLAKAFR